MSRFPGNKSFAFTILDDTDDSTLENVRPIYDLLAELGMRTTKTAWPMSCPEGNRLFFAAETLQDPDYLKFVKSLVSSGFELASHGATMGSSLRGRTEDGLDFLKKEFDCELTMYCNHGGNLENIYWGLDRYQVLPLRMTLGILKRLNHRSGYLGHVKGTPYFWGDLCRENFKYVRNFTFDKLDISDLRPGCPYRLKSTPYVNYWFSTADAPDASSFRKLVTKEAVDALIRNQGYSIISTHLGKGFVRNGKVDEHVKEMLTYISKQSGWFVPVSSLLDHLLQGQDRSYLSAVDQYFLELEYIGAKIKEKISNKLRKVI